MWVQELATLDAQDVLHEELPTWTNASVERRSEVEKMVRTPKVGETLRVEVHFARKFFFGARECLPYVRGDPSRGPLGNEMVDVR